MSDHDFEPIPGLPEALPEGERILWQGAPRWQALALRLFQVDKLSLYFVLLALISSVTSWFETGSITESLLAALLALPLALVSIGLLTLIAWLISGTTIYTLTNRRIVMRIGVALPIILNIPLRLIESASLRLNADGSGDISILLCASERIAYLHLWPHAQPWRYSRPLPMLRGLPEARQAADILAGALQATSGQTQQSPSTTTVPATDTRMGHVATAA